MGRPPFRKQLGQHHLRSGALCRPLLEFLACRDQAVVEIGPGGGVLTAELSHAGAKVLALELDLPWACHLAQRHLPGVTVLALDAACFPWGLLPSPVVVTGNLPFNVGTHLVDLVLGALFERPGSVLRAGFMVQKEVGERLAAAPATPAYGALSVLSQVRATVKPLGLVAAGSFNPPPKVAAMFVGLEPRPELLPRGRYAAFRQLVFAAFAHRRKTLLNNLGAWRGKRQAAEWLERANLAPQRRAESLDLGEFLVLFAAEARDGGETATLS